MFSYCCEILRFAFVTRARFAQDEDRQGRNKKGVEVVPYSSEVSSVSYRVYECEVS